jgi:O-antigen ligase
MFNLSSKTIEPAERLTGNFLMITVYSSLTLIGLIFVIPLLQPFRVPPLASFYSEWLAIVLGAGACLAFLLRDFWDRLLVPRVALYLLGLVVLIGIQGTFIKHEYAAQALLPALYLSWAIALVALAGWLREHIGLEKIVFILAWFILIGGALQSLIGLAQYLDTPGWLASWINLSGGRGIFGNTGQRNHFADIIVFASIALVYLSAHARLSRILAFVLIGLFAIVLTLSGSRAALLYALAIFSLAVVGYWKARDTIHLHFVLMSGLLLVSFVLAQYFLPPISAWLKLVVAQLGFDSSQVGLLTALERGPVQGIDLRLSEWHKAWLMFLQAPILGVGVGHYGWHSFLYQSMPEFAAISKQELFHHAHNLFMQLLAEMGGIGLLILITLLWGWLRQYAKDWLRPTHWFIGASLLILFIHSNLEYPLWYSYFLGIAVFLLGLGDRRMIKVSFTPRLGQITAGAVLFIIGTILGITFTGYQQLAKVNTLIATTNPEQAARTLQGVSNNALLKPWAEALMATHGVMDKGIIERQLALTTRVMLHHPNPIKVRRHIQYLAIAGHTGEAIVLLRQAAMAYPAHVVDYICLWQAIPDKELRPILHEALNLWREPVHCGASPDEGST